MSLNNRILNNRKYTDIEILAMLAFVAIYSLENYFTANGCYELFPI